MERCSETCITHERLSGPFPPRMPFIEKLRLINWQGLSPENPARIWTLVVIVGIVFAVLLWMR
jgi:hypothetical protein